MFSRRKDLRPRLLLIKNLHPTVSISSLTRLLKNLCPLAHISSVDILDFIPKEAYVEFQTPDDTIECLDLIDKFVFLGVPIDVSFYPEPTLDVWLEIERGKQKRIAQKEKVLLASSRPNVYQKSGEQPQTNPTRSTPVTNGEDYFQPRGGRETTTTTTDPQPPYQQQQSKFPIKNGEDYFSQTKKVHKLPYIRQSYPTINNQNLQKYSTEDEYPQFASPTTLQKGEDYFFSQPSIQYQRYNLSRQSSPTTSSSISLSDFQHHHHHHQNQPNLFINANRSTNPTDRSTNPTDRSTNPTDRSFHQCPPLASPQLSPNPLPPPPSHSKYKKHIPHLIKTNFQQPVGPIASPQTTPKSASSSLSSMGGIWGHPSSTALLSPLSNGLGSVYSPPTTPTSLFDHFGDGEDGGRGQVSIFRW